MTDALLTLAEAAKRCGVSIRTMEREARDGKLEIRRLRSVRLIAPTELDRYIASLPCQSAKSATVGKLESLSAIADVLSARYRQGQPAPTRGNSKLRSAARKSTLRLVKNPDT